MSVGCQLSVCIMRRASNLLLTVNLHLPTALCLLPTHGLLLTKFTFNQLDKFRNCLFSIFALSFNTERRALGGGEDDHLHHAFPIGLARFFATLKHRDADVNWLATSTNCIAGRACRPSVLQIFVSRETVPMVVKCRVQSAECKVKKPAVELTISCLSFCILHSALCTSLLLSLIRLFQQFHDRLAGGALAEESAEDILL